MSGSLQSHDYVPGRSGFKIDLKAGEFELNSARISVGSLPTDPQLIVITAGEWSDSELPSNAIERYKFIGEQLAAIPDECRDSAEFSTEDISFDRDGSDYRTTLTYERRETAEEVTARLSKPKGSTFKIAGRELTFSRDGVAHIQLTDLPDLRAPEQPEPFKVIDGKVCISEAFVKDASITNAKITNSAIEKTRPGFYIPIPGVFVDADGRVIVCDAVANADSPTSSLSALWSVKTKEGVNGLYAAGIGMGLSSQFAVSADRFAVNGRNASDIFRDIAGEIGETKLGRDLKEQVDLLDSNLADQVKAVIRKELLPGGLLYRSR